MLKLVPPVDREIEWIEVGDAIGQTFRASLAPPIGAGATVSTRQSSLIEAAEAAAQHLIGEVLVRYRQLESNPAWRQVVLAAPFDPIGLDGGAARLRALAELGILESARALEDDLDALLRVFAGQLRANRLPPRLAHEVRASSAGSQTGAAAIDLELPEVRGRGVQLEALLAWPDHIELAVTIEPSDSVQLPSDQELRALEWSASDDTGHQYVGGAGTIRRFRRSEEVRVALLPALRPEARTLTVSCRGGTESAAIVMPLGSFASAK